MGLEAAIEELRKDVAKAVSKETGIAEFIEQCIGERWVVFYPDRQNQGWVWMGIPFGLGSNLYTEVPLVAFRAEWGSDVSESGARDLASGMLSALRIEETKGAMDRMLQLVRCLGPDTVFADPSGERLWIVPSGTVDLVAGGRA